MKQRTLACVLAAALAACAAHAQETMSVQVREGALRERPSFLGQITARLSYGDQVTLLEQRQGWARVSAGEAQGWIHESALTAKRIVLRPGQQDVELAATSDELALAGKGFNAQVEAEFKARNADLNYAWVDRMEQIRIPPQKIEAFLKAGEVVPQEGGAR